MSVNYLKILKDEWRGAVAVTAGVLILSLILTIVQPFKYSAKTRLLVIPAASGMDAYSAMKSAEKIGGSLAQIIHTSSFFEKVTQSQPGIENIWNKDEKTKREQWEKTVTTEVVYGTGMVDIVAYHKDKNQAILLAKAIADTLAKDGRNYFGMAGLQIIMVSSPLASTYPVKPNLLLNGLMGLILGLLAGIAYTAITYHPAIRNFTFRKPAAPAVEKKTEEKEGDDRSFNG